MEWRRREGDGDGLGLYVGKVFHISLRNANVRARSVKGGWKYELVAEMTAEDFDLFNGHDLTGSCFEAQIECTEVAQLPLVEEKPDKPKGGPLSQEAAKKCREPLFQRFAHEMAKPELRDSVQPEGLAAEFIRVSCGIESRADLDHDEQAAAAFRDLMGQFHDWYAMQA